MSQMGDNKLPHQEGNIMKESQILKNAYAYIYIYIYMRKSQKVTLIWQ
jgi:hypothetical protein